MIQYIVSNKHFTIKIILTFSTILLLCIYSYKNGPEESIYFDDCLKNPDTCEGKIVLAVVGRVISVEREKFKMHSKSQEILVVGVPEGIRKNMYVDVSGVFHQEGYIALNSYHMHRERKIKIYVSLIAFFIVICLLVKNFLLNRKHSHL